MTKLKGFKGLINFRGFVTSTPEELSLYATAIELRIDVTSFDFVVVLSSSVTVNIHFLNLSLDLSVDCQEAVSEVLNENLVHPIGE
jgi:hypothetical protein